MALNIGVSGKSIQRFEKGTCAVKAEILSAISQFFEVSMDTLFGTDGKLKDFVYQDLLTRRFQNSVNAEKSYYVGNVTFVSGTEFYKIVGHTMWTLNFSNFISLCSILYCDTAYRQSTQMIR